MVYVAHILQLVLVVLMCTVSHVAKDMLGIGIKPYDPLQMNVFSESNRVFCIFRCYYLKT